MKFRIQASLANDSESEQTVIVEASDDMDAAMEAMSRFRWPAYTLIHVQPLDVPELSESPLDVNLPSLV